MVTVDKAISSPPPDLNLAISDGNIIKMSSDVKNERAIKEVDNEKRCESDASH